MSTRCCALTIRLPRVNKTRPNPRGEMVRLFTASFHKGSDLSPADRSYVAKVVSARTGLSQADAEKRVNDVVHSGERPILDAARKAAMADRDLADAIAVHRRVLGVARRDRRRRTARRHLGKEGLRHASNQSLTPQNERRDTCLFYFGSLEFRFPLIILIMLLLHH